METGQEIAKAIHFELKKKFGQSDCKDNNTLVTTIAKANAQSIAAVEPE